MLVVDDEPSILRALRINLTARNYQVSTASDGASGLAAMARDRPDVMILDLGLPDMDGTEVIRGVRGSASTPIIVLSVWGHESQKVATLDVASATALATQMVREYGLSDKLGPVSYAGQPADPFPGLAAARGYSEHTQWLLDQEVTALLTTAETRARELLTRHREALTQLTAALLEQETIADDQVRALVQAACPSSLPARTPASLPAGNPPGPAASHQP